MIGQRTTTLLQSSKVERPYIEKVLIPASNGRIKLNVTTWDDRGLTGNELARLTSNGQVDITWMAYSNISGDFPIADGLDLAGLNTTAEAAQKAADAFLPALNKSVESAGITFLNGVPFAAQVFYCREPFGSLADLKGKTIRTFGVTLNDLVKAIGGQPVSIASSEVYSALERGVVDCAITGTATGNSAKWYEVTKAYLNLYLSWGTSAYAVNTKWWNGLPADVREFLSFHFNEMAKQLTALAIEITTDGSFCNQGLADKCKLGSLAPAKNAMKEIQPTAGDRAFLSKTLTDTVIPAWVKRCGLKCGDAFNQYLATVTGVKYVP
jgi:TRAP-type C4-dicarboxylate transport system substrate-binding protein